MQQSSRIAGYVFGFLALFALVVGIVTVLMRNFFAIEQVNPTGTALYLGIAVLLIITIVPVFLLKKLGKMSRRVEHDQSDFKASRIAEHQDRPNIQYH
jgi:Na+-transporting methylmalonyl-CoA/oxaloacetate decarboxylase gamma subunit